MSRPHNQHGRKHGLYSDVLSPAAAADLAAANPALSRTDLAEEIALARVHLRDLFRQHAEPSVIHDGLKLLVQVLRAHHKLSGAQDHALAVAIDAALSELLGGEK